MTPPRLLLVGCGHAHLGVLDSLQRDDWPDVEVVVVSPEPRQFYSGMVPGFLQGQYDVSDPVLDVATVVERAGARFVQGWVERVDGQGREVEVAAATGDGRGSHERSGDAHRDPLHEPSETLSFDLASLDVGSIPGGLTLPGVEEHAWSLRPMERAVALRRRVDERAEEVQVAAEHARAAQTVYGGMGAHVASDGRVRVVVVGAGAGGVEVALALERRIRERGAEPRVTLVDQEAAILGEGYDCRVQARAFRILEEKGVEVRLGDAAVEVEGSGSGEGARDGVRLESGDRIPADLVVWTTGAAPPPLLAGSSLPLDSDGFFAVDATLRATDGSPVWGAGDCVSVAGHDIPRAGVYAVRQGPVLARNLRAAVAGEEPREYDPQSSFLSLLNTADDRALLRWWRIVYHGRTAWWLKDWIDRRWVERYR